MAKHADPFVYDEALMLDVSGNVEGKHASDEAILVSGQRLWVETNDGETVTATVIGSMLVGGRRVYDVIVAWFGNRPVVKSCTLTETVLVGGDANLWLAPLAVEVS